jgi:hypothetical protein
MTVSASLAAVRAVPRALRAAGGRAADQVRRQFITRNRRVAAGLTVAAVVIAVAAVHVSAWWFSPGLLILPILCGGLLLWPRALRILFGVVAAALIYDVIKHKAGAGIVATIAVTAVFADVLANTRGKLGARRRVRQGDGRGHQGAAALRGVRRHARLGAQGAVPARVQRLPAPRQGR